MTLFRPSQIAISLAFLSLCSLFVTIVRRLSNAEGHTLRVLSREINSVIADIETGPTKVAIPSIVYNQTSQKEAEMCAICLVGFVAEDIAKELRCKHCYHAGCLDQWLKVSTMCPLCKRSAEAPLIGEQDFESDEGSEIRAGFGLLAAKGAVAGYRDQAVEATGGTPSSNRGASL